MKDAASRFETLATEAGLVEPRLEPAIRFLLDRGTAILEGDWGSACGVAADLDSGLDCLEALANVRRGDQVPAALRDLTRADRTFRAARREVFVFWMCAAAAGAERNQV